MDSPSVLSLLAANYWRTATEKNLLGFFNYVSKFYGLAHAHKLTRRLMDAVIHYQEN